MRRLVCLLAAATAACGSSPPPPAAHSTPPVEHGPSKEELAAQQRAHDEQVQREQIVAAHRQIESEQQDALAMTCTAAKGAPPPPPRCEPSCYTPEAPDPRAGTKITGATEIAHVVCQSGDSRYAISDELAPAKLRVRPWAHRFPPGHKKGSWQADVETALKDTWPGKLPKSDVFVVESNWRDVTNPLTHEALKCVNVSHYTTTLRGKLDACGGTGKVACEAAGDPISHALSVIHFRVAEARQLDTANNLEGCARAALEALAVSRGLPRWRQYKKLNVRGQWTDAVAFRTRFDGTLDEDALFEAAATLGTEAEKLYTDCARIQGVKTKVDQEQSFHTCF